MHERESALPTHEHRAVSMATEGKRVLCHEAIFFGADTLTRIQSYGGDVLKPREELTLVVAFEIARQEVGARLPAPLSQLFVGAEPVHFLQDLFWGHF